LQKLFSGLNHFFVYNNARRWVYSLQPNAPAGGFHSDSLIRINKTEEEGVGRPCRDTDKPMGRLTTHVLDSAHGCPGHGIKIELYRVEGQQLELIATRVTNDDGRCDEPLLQGEDFRAGVYQLLFNAGDYYRARGVELPQPAFLDQVVLRFGIASESDHYHVPLLISPYSYSTYRGS